MILNISAIFFISSIYFIKDLILNKNSIHLGSLFGVLATTLWWLLGLNHESLMYPNEYSAGIIAMLEQAIFLTYFDQLSIKNQRTKTIILNLNFIWIGVFFIINAGLIYTQSMVMPVVIALSLLTSIAHFTLFFITQKKTHIGIYLNKPFETWVMLSFIIIQAIIILLPYDLITDSAILISFSVIFYSIHAIIYPKRLLQIAINAAVFTALLVSFSTGYIHVLKAINYPHFTTPIEWLGFLISPIVFWGFLHLFFRLEKKIQTLPLFSIFHLTVFNEFSKQLETVTNETILKEKLNQTPIFKSSRHSFHIWNIQNNTYTHLTENTPTLDPDIILFLQYKEIVYATEIQSLSMAYQKTPFHNNIRLLKNFMHQFSITKISLFQNSNQIIGIFALSLHHVSAELPKMDDIRLKNLESVLCNTIYNTNSVTNLLNHQNKLECINFASSKFNISISEDAYSGIIRKTIFKILPEIQFYFLLEYDSDSQFYKQSQLFSKKPRNQPIKIHSSILNNDFNNNLCVKYSFHNKNIPNELINAMKHVSATDIILIRLNESTHSSVFALFFKTSIDILDYRISFCQMFLRQCEIFYQYQKNCSQLNKIQLFLKNILDQLPTGILITNKKYNLKYSNSKMNEQLGLSQKNLITDLRNINIPLGVIDCISACISKKSHTQKIKFSCQDYPQQTHYHAVSAFSLNQDKETNIVIVLTNIQQSKELIEQMNQTNRLAMMSKIAKGVSFELSKPVEQLINGVKRIETEWMNFSFQDFFEMAVIPQVDRINILCQSLLRLSRSGSESQNEVFLPELLDQVHRLISGDLSYSTHQFYTGILDRTWIIVDHVMAMQVLMNLMMFCLKSLAIESSHLTLDIQIVSKTLLNIKITVKNFNPEGFTKESNIYDQLELSIVNQIVINQNGQFSITRENNTAIFNVFLPIKKINPIKRNAPSPIKTTRKYQ